jgi:hypothetical protein
MAAALQETLRGELTTAGIGIVFERSSVAGDAIESLSGPRRFYFAVSSGGARGNLVLVADDQALLSQLLHNVAMKAETATAPAILIGVFHHSSQRGPYLRLTSLIDGTQDKARTRGKAGAANEAGGEGSPAFFSQNVGSLSDTFADLQSERVMEQVVDSNLRQTVTYDWGSQ